MKGSRIDHNRKENPYNNPFSNEKNWIGGDLPSETAPNASPGQLSVDRTRNEWIEKRKEGRGQGKPQGETRMTVGLESHVSRAIAIGNKSPVQLMQDILKGARQGE